MIGAQPPEKPVIVVGMGPGGMVAAIEAAKKGKTVVVIENRENFTRSQRIRVSEENIKYLTTLQREDKKKRRVKADPDDDFIQILAKEQHVPLDLLQDFLERKLRSFPSITVYKGAEYKIEDIELSEENSILTLFNTKTGVRNPIAFGLLVGADGASHGMANKVLEATQTYQQKLPAGANLPQYDLKYEPLEQQPRQEAHGTIALRLNAKGFDKKVREKAISDAALRADGIKPWPELDIPVQFKDLAFSDNYRNFDILKKFGWDQTYLPGYVLLQDSSGTHFYLASEIPTTILQTADKEKRQALMIEWGKCLFALEIQPDLPDANPEGKNAAFNRPDYALDMTDLELDISDELDQRSIDSNKLKVTVFPVKLQYATTPSFELPSGSAFALLGDASKSAYFLLGHGANHAMDNGIQLGACLGKQFFYCRDYNAHHRKQRDHVLGLIQPSKEDLENYDKQLFQLIEHEMKELLALADLYQEDEKIQLYKVDYNNAMEETPTNYDKAFIAITALTKALNDKAQASWVAYATPLENNINRKLAKTKKQLLAMNKLFNAGSKVSARLGHHLQEKSIALRQELFSLIQQKETLQQQKEIDKPAVLDGYRAKIENIRADIAKKVAKQEEEVKNDPDAEPPELR